MLRITRIWLRWCFYARELCISAKESYISAKKTCNSTKQPNISTKKICIPQKSPAKNTEDLSALVFVHKRALYLRKNCTYTNSLHLCLAHTHATYTHTGIGGTARATAGVYGDSQYCTSLLEGHTVSIAARKLVGPA